MKENILTGQNSSSPASLIQLQFWVLHNFSPNSSDYNIPLVSVIAGELDTGALEKAFNALLKKYRNFRATFRMDNKGVLTQEFISWKYITIPIIELRRSDISQICTNKLEQLLVNEVRSSFNLSKGPLIRAKLFHLEKYSYVLAITVHHIIFDLATSKLFAEELSKAYSAVLNGLEDTESIETTEYAEYSQWQKEWAKSDDYKRIALSWENFLQNFQPSLDLHLHQIECSGVTQSGSIIPLRLSHDMSEKINLFCQKEAVTPFVVLLAAWARALARFTGQKKITVGVPLTNRRKSEFKKTMGCFVNIMPLPVDIDSGSSVIDTIRKIRLAMLKIHRMQEMPYYELVQHMRQKGVIGNSSLFQAGFTFEPPMQLHLEGLSVNPWYIHHGGAQLDLFAKFWLEQNEFTGHIEYNSSRLKLSAIKKLSEDFMSIAGELCTVALRDPGAATKENDQKKLMDILNDTEMSYPSDACIHQLFEKQACLTPDNIAVEFGNEQLTYAELDRRSSRFASYLHTLGAGPDGLIGLYIDRSLEMVIALLGILKAGGAYLPLDRIFPKERLISIIQDANPNILVTARRLLDDLPGNQSEIVCIDDFPDPCAEFSSCNVSKPDNLAYVLYTSGSTGKPKGVEISHRAFVNFLSSMSREPGINEKDVLLSVTTISFDIFGLELWLPLISGAKTIIVRQEASLDGKYLASVITEKNVTIMQGTPATWQILLDSAWNGKSDLKILCGGEAWSENLANQLLPKCASLWNMYGPTETTVWSAVCRIQADDAVLIGPPIANTQFYVVDSNLAQAQEGNPGELLIGGLGLARGYLNHPELTAERFISDIFRPNKNSRLYRTGDLVRYLPSKKRFEFVGRIDRQVKIRGFRIELGEIESAINSIHGVRQTAVNVHGNEDEKRMMAYIVMQKDAVITEVELRSLLKQKLPLYMLPSSFIFLKEMPLTTNGKINYKALPSVSEIKNEPASKNIIRKIDSKIIEWNKTEKPYPLDRPLQTFIEEQVEKTPDMPAVKYENTTLSYRDFNRQVNRLAHYLRSKGVGPEKLVGVCAFRSIEMVIALHAVIKAGGAYVPIDPTYPLKRVSFMLEDSRSSIILAQKACGHLLNACSSDVIYFEDIQQELESFPDTNPNVINSPEDTAYVIYTSGSTGKPKGALNTHRGIVNRLIWMQEQFNISSSESLIQKTPFSFDVSVWEFFWPFMFGARLVIARPEGHRDADYLLDLIKNENISVIHFVPSMLRLFLEKADKVRCKTLRYIILSGEALSTDLQNRYFSVLDIPLYNLYGPTEAAVDVTCWKCDPQSKSKVVPIGRAVSNTKLYILDEMGLPVPVGESGELYIGGVQVARGYLNRPELTAERFIADMFSDDPSARLYKTGDLCRFMEDGNIEYLGRIDFQVKIRGNRVELGEVEAVILKNSSVKDCMVIAREDTPGEQYLAAYIVDDGGSFSVADMREKLKAELPDYMIPAVFIAIPSLPLTPSGKTDRLALPSPDHKRPNLANTYVASRSEVERDIVKAWKDLLGIDSVGIDDNFFDLGGHSLLLVRLADIMGRLFDSEISVMSLFEYPTVREQAVFVNGIKRKAMLSADVKQSGGSTSDEDLWEDGEI